MFPMVVLELLLQGRESQSEGCEIGEPLSLLFAVRPAQDHQVLTGLIVDTRLKTN